MNGEFRKMGRTVRNVALLAGSGIFLSIGVVVLNQSVQVVQLARSVDPALGSLALWGLIGAYAACLGVPLVVFVRLPGALVPPDREDGPEFAAHLERLRSRLASNPHLVGRNLADRPGLDEALRTLDARADAIIKEAAAGVLLSTAVSQSGRLDGVLVLAAQSRMVWRIAHLYHQRPSAREMAALYANVAATTFLAGEVQDVDLSEQVEPILSAAIGSIGANVPGFQVAGAILANCVLGGSANAFLTLRVGMIAKRQCGALVSLPRPALRRLASAEAARHLGGIVAEGTSAISRAVWRSSVSKVGDAVSRVTDFARGAGERLRSRA